MKNMSADPSENNPHLYKDGDLVLDNRMTNETNTT